MTNPSLRPDWRNRWRPAAVSVAIALAAGVVGGLATASSVKTWYTGLHKPAFNPPNGVFAPVWTTLYIVMGLAAWRVWRTGAGAKDRRPALGVYAVQLALNLAWSILFFGLRQPATALAEVLALDLAVLATMALFWRVDRLAGLMLIPYVAWTCFASLLNYEIWRLN